MSKITFRCCKYLDHTAGRYIECKLKSLHNMAVYWERGEIWTDGGKPKNVQFCSKRGRLNDKVACLEGCGGECSEYDEEERTVEIDE